MNYTGTVLLVSHDRAFINNVVTSTLVFEGDGVVKEYVGGYDDWLRQRPTEAKPVKISKDTTADPGYPDQGQIRIPSAKRTGITDTDYSGAGNRTRGTCTKQWAIPNLYKKDKSEIVGQAGTA